MFEKSRRFLEVEAFCISNFYQLPMDLDDCRTYLFDATEEKMNAYQTKERQKVRLKLRSPVQQGDILRSLRDIGVEEHADKIVVHRYDKVYSPLLNSLRKKT